MHMQSYPRIQHNKIIKSFFQKVKKKSYAFLIQRTCLCKMVINFLLGSICIKNGCDASQNLLSYMLHACKKLCTVQFVPRYKFSIYSAFSRGLLSAYSATSQHLASTLVICFVIFGKGSKLQKIVLITRFQRKVKSL